VSLPEHHPYGRARGQFGELFMPHGDAPFPVAVVLHGGFWKAQYGRRQTHAVCADLAERGWAAWNVEYRRLGRLSGGGYSATLDDVSTAVDHLAEIPAHDEGVLDTARIVAIGHSAGGQLAAWLATRKRPRVAVAGVVAQAGLLDLLMASELRLSNGVVHRFLGGTPREVPERYTRASPAEQLPLGVPALVTHGARDDTVPVEMSERFAAAARAAGDDVELVIEPDEGHYGHLDPDNPLWQAVTTWLTNR
jgi:acetyl esterase/lipase